MKKAPSGGTSGRVVASCPDDLSSVPLSGSFFALSIYPSVAHPLGGEMLTGFSEKTQRLSGAA